MKLLIASDHAGFQLKEALKKNRPDIEWTDLGTMSEESTPYPKHAQALCEKLIDTHTHAELTNPLGVLICGSGVGVSMQANRYMGIRAALCWSEEVAVLSRQHNAANVLCLGSRLVKPEDALKIFDAWSRTPFEGGRHAERIKMMDEECECC